MKQDYGLCEFWYGDSMAIVWRYYGDSGEKIFILSLKFYLFL
jgi:hypothetical protein